MIKKYEIINDGGKKRIKALRSFHVQGRYVNIGDVGGIVYDENTLSQEGNCWIFSGNLNYPSIRVSGDSIVDTNGYEADVTGPRPFVNITGTSALIGAHDFVTGSLAARELAVADVEQGSVSVALGTTYEERKVNNANVIRLKSLIYTGKAVSNVTVSGEGYEVQVLRYGANKRLASSSSWGTAAAINGADYIAILIRKTPGAATVPADITAAKAAVPALFIDAYLDINDSRLEFQYTSAMTVATKVNPGYESSDVRKSVIDTSNVVISKAGGTAFGARIYADITQCNVAFTTVNAESTLGGTFENVKNLTYNGSFLAEYSLTLRKNLIVSGCDNFALSTATLTIPGVNTANAANMPFTFIRCNVPDGRFYHNATIKNTYTDIDFAKASDDLAKTTANGLVLVSSEVEGMYHLYHVASKKLGALVESYDSVKDANFSDLATMVATTIYKDAKLTGLFNISGTNVFGGTGNHEGGKGCEITNTKETAMVISGNVRVEGNATVKDVSITGTGYFGGDSVTEAPAALAAAMPIAGMVYMGDKAVFKPGTVNASAGLTILEMRDNAVFNGALSAASTLFNVSMFNSAIFSGALNARNGFVMRGNSYVASGAAIASTCRGLLVLKDKARVEAGTLTAVGAITLEGTYKQASGKTWVGKRTITDVNSPEYDNNVKTQYDF